MSYWPLLFGAREFQWSYILTILSCCVICCSEKKSVQEQRAEGNPISKKEQEIRLQDQGTSTLLRDAENSCLLNIKKNLESQPTIYNRRQSCCISNKMEDWPFSCDALLQMTKKIIGGWKPILLLWKWAKLFLQSSSGTMPAKPLSILYSPPVTDKRKYTFGSLLMPCQRKQLTDTLG